MKYACTLKVSSGRMAGWSQAGVGQRSSGSNFSWLDWLFRSSSMSYVAETSLNLRWASPLSWYRRPPCFSPFRGCGGCVQLPARSGNWLTVACMPSRRIGTISSLLLPGGREKTGILRDQLYTAA